MDQNLPERNPWRRRTGGLCLLCLLFGIVPALAVPPAPPRPAPVAQIAAEREPTGPVLAHASAIGPEAFADVLWDLPHPLVLCHSDEGRRGSLPNDSARALTLFSPLAAWSRPPPEPLHS